jgi:hypothetical protein
MANLLDWGPVIWWLFALLAANYPDKPNEETRQSWMRWFLEWPARLPCSICGNHLQSYIEKLPIYPATASRELLERYIYDLHEDVNRRRGRPSMHTFEEVQSKFRGYEPWTQWGGYRIGAQTTNNIPTTFAKSGKDEGVPVSLQANEKQTKDNTTFIIIIAVVAGVFLVTLVIGLSIYSVKLKKKYHALTLDAGTLAIAEK